MKCSEQVKMWTSTSTVCLTLSQRKVFPTNTHYHTVIIPSGWLSHARSYRKSYQEIMLTETSKQIKRTHMQTTF